MNITSSRKAYSKLRDQNEFAEGGTNAINDSYDQLKEDDVDDGDAFSELENL